MWPDTDQAHLLFSDSESDRTSECGSRDDTVPSSCGDDLDLFLDDFANDDPTVVQLREAAQRLADNQPVFSASDAFALLDISNDGPDADDTQPTLCQYDTVSETGDGDYDSAESTVNGYVTPPEAWPVQEVPFPRDNSRKLGCILAGTKLLLDILNLAVGWNKKGDEAFEQASDSGDSDSGDDQVNDNKVADPEVADDEVTDTKDGDGEDADDEHEMSDDENSVPPPEAAADDDPDPVPDVAVTCGIPAETHLLSEHTVLCMSAVFFVGLFALMCVWAYLETNDAEMANFKAYYTYYKWVFESHVVPPVKEMFEKHIRTPLQQIDLQVLFISLRTMFAKNIWSFVGNVWFYVQHIDFRKEVAYYVNYFWSLFDNVDTQPIRSSFYWSMYPEIPTTKEFISVVEDFRSLVDHAATASIRSSSQHVTDVAVYIKTLYSEPLHEWADHTTPLSYWQSFASNEFPITSRTTLFLIGSMLLTGVLVIVTNIDYTKPKGVVYFVFRKLHAVHIPLNIWTVMLMLVVNLISVLVACMLVFARPVYVSGVY
jgi:predicted phosphatase